MIKFSVNMQKMDQTPSLAINFPQNQKKIMRTTLHVYVVLSCEKFAHTSVLCNSFQIEKKFNQVNLKMIKHKKCSLSNFQT